MFDFLKHMCDRCSKRFSDEGIYFPSRRKVFCSQACANDYTEELERRGELRISKDEPLFEAGCCG